MALPKEDKEETIKMVIDDLRRLYDHITNSYNNLKNRVLALIAGEVAIVTFIFSNDWLSDPKFTVAEKFFFFVGISLLGLAFGFLLWIVSTADWQVPLDLSESKKLYKKFDSKLEFMEYIKEDYECCIEYCLQRISIRSKVYNRTLFILSCAIIILLVLKFTRQGG